MKLAYRKTDGGVAILHAAPRETLALVIGKPQAPSPDVMFSGITLPKTLSEEDYLAHVLERNGLAGEQVIRLPDEWIAPNAPREAWVLTETGEIGVDAQKAAAIYQHVYGAVVDRHVNATAHARGYDNSVSLVSYRFDEARPTWAAEAEAFFAWRSQLWTYAIAQLAAVLAGERPRPSVDELLAELPAIVWPT